MGTKSWHPTQTRNAWLPVEKLLVDPTYERPINPRKVSKIAAEFDPDAVGTLYVSERADGTYAIMDGQHRHAAVARLWGEAAQVPCLIYMGLTRAQEAQLFVDFNESRTRPHAIDLFAAKVTAEDPDAMAITRVLHGLGLRVQNGPGHGHVNCVRTLERVHRLAGDDVLTKALDTLVRTWGFDAASVQGNLVAGVAACYARFPSVVTRERMVRALHGTTPGQIIAKARMAKEVGLDQTINGRNNSTSIDGLVAQQIAALYSKGLRDESKRITWESRHETHFWIEESEYRAEMARRAAKNGKNATP